MTLCVTNSEPRADDDWFYVTHDTTLEGNIKLNDSDHEMSDLTIDFKSTPSNGQIVAWSMDGNFTYEPDYAFVGTDTFTYTLDDGIDESNVATVTIEVGNEAPMAEPIDDVWHWARDATTSEYVSLWDHFDDPDDTDQQLSYTIQANTNQSVVGTSIDAGTGVLTLSFSGLAGVAEITVRGTDRPGENAETTVTVYSVDVTDYAAERRSWGGGWTACAPGDLLWGADEHRWTVSYEPAGLPIGTVYWQIKPWDLRDDPEELWETFAWGADAGPTEGEPGTGDWAIAPVVDFGPLLVQMAPPRHQPLVAITGLEWRGVDSNFQIDPYLGGYRIFAESNFPGGPIHNRVDARVSITPPMPAGYSGTVDIKVFDPDYYQDGGSVGTADDGDPNDHEPTSHTPNDNFDGLGMSPAFSQVTFNAGDSQQTIQFTIDDRRAGNNFLLGVHHDASALGRYEFMPDGKNLYVLRDGEQDLIMPPYRSDNWLTVWRSLWMELDDMVAPDTSPSGDGPFTEPGVGEDDVYLDPGTPPIALTQSELQWALIEVKPLPAQYNEKDATPNDDTGTAEFRHNMSALISTDVSAPVRDVASDPDFWVVHTIGAYEEEVTRDWDPNGEANSWLGWAYQYGSDGSNFIFYETIRDRQLIDPLPNPPVPVDLGTLQNRVVLHEALHRFLGAHGTAGTGADEGIMDYSTCLYGSAQQNELTPRQIRVIHEKTYPR